jgi:hypothetical protein
MTFKPIQGDFETCADILTTDRSSQWVTIKPEMPYTYKCWYFLRKRGKIFQKKVWKPLNFMKKWVKKKYRTFLLSFNSKLSHFEKTST